MNDHRYEPEVEHEFYDTHHDRDLYRHYLWATQPRTVQGQEQREPRPSGQPARARKRFSLPEKAGREVWEETRYNRWEIYRKPDAIFSIPERVLLSTGTQASDWQKRHGARPRESQDQRASKRSGKMALRSVSKTLQSKRKQGPIRLRGSWNPGGF